MVSAVTVSWVMRSTYTSLSSLCSLSPTQVTQDPTGKTKRHLPSLRSYIYKHIYTLPGAGALIPFQRRGTVFVPSLLVLVLVLVWDKVSLQQFKLASNLQPSYSRPPKC